MKRLTVTALSFALAAIACSGSRAEGLDPSKIPDDMHADYDLFTKRCSKCHSLARPLAANITDDEQWVMYVNRMRRQPGSGISYDDQTHILRFLKWYAADLRRIQEDKRNGGAASASASAVPPAPPAPPAPAPPVPAAPPAAPPPQDGGP